MTKIRRVAVLGAGVMGSGIAAHLANAGIDSLLYDIVPKDADDRLAFAKKGIQTALKIRPAAFMHPSFAGRITPCTYDDHADRLKEADWIVEVVSERLDIKQHVYRWVAEHRRPGSIVTSNTSGIKLADMTAEMDDELRQHFMITHFFNPVRYMKLLELVPGPDTRDSVVAAMADFGSRALGKGIVYGKDTPNFIANRIGTFGMASVFRHMERLGLTVEQVDKIFGKPLGRPSSAVFRTGDLVGLDTLKHVFSNVYDNAPEDERRDWFVVPDFVSGLIADGRTGAKAGAGFYKKVKVDGKSEILVVDPKTLEYRAQEKVRFECMGKARKEESLAGRMNAMVYGDDPAADAAWSVTADTLIYSANRIPEIADDIVNVDNALKWGFGWDAGPFEMWDAIGVAKSVERMEAEGRTVPAWVKAMLASGRTSFYEDGSYWAVDGSAAGIPSHPRHLVLSTLKKAGLELERNVSGSLFDLGDGVLGLEFHSKMNSLDDLIFGLYGAALDKLDNDEFDALVVGNQHPRAFSVGANVLMVLMSAMQQDWDSIETSIRSLQQLMMRAKYCRKPVVTAPHGLALGGGCEVAMHSAMTVAAGELYCGLVEVGVGVIPAGGGTKELAMRYLGEGPQTVDYDPNPFLNKAFEQIGLGKVSTSAEEAREMFYLRRTDKVVLDADAVLAEAKRAAFGLAVGGYEPPAMRTIKVPGPSGKAAIELYLYSMGEGGFATDHDITVGTKLAHVLTGGDRPAGTVVSEQDLLDLEREAFLSLCGEPKTHARIQHMLQTNKPLRN